MNRRGFLGSLATAAAAMVLDPERLLWVPGEKTIFIPSAELLPPPRVPLGVLLNSGRIVYADEFVLNGKQVIRDLGHFKEGRFTYSGIPMWIQCRGASSFLDYSPSLAS